MIIDVIGAGALGLLYGGRLAASGELIRLWVRTEEQASELGKNGIHITDPKGHTSKVQVSNLQIYVINRFKEIWEGQPGDLMMIMTKQGAINDVIEMLTSADVDIPIYCFQNGTGHTRKIASALPKAYVFAAVTTEGAKRTSKHEVIRAGYGETLLQSCEEDQTKAVNVMMYFIEALSKAGFTTKSSNEIDKLVYRKLMINAIINPLTSIWRITNGELLHSSYRLQAMKQLYIEAALVYDALSIPYEADLWEQVIQVCRSTASNRSSMCTDVVNGKATEIDAINGSIIDMAKEAGVATPGHELVYKIVQGMLIEEEV
ncbi:ketopantoate reductase family protein [Paenibacillus gallinarum]|uniref:2-dehydropantoate 2-reductase n=1 Tax=Paenibacillus gallinarum TaxID=2762232 RepID=A0ABR8SVT3_9BACL|nr:ketopantoate reductase family protein [Paenibacillus gallinarum]MBD7967627.1 ketopantoate reductase family protein [Paenibacillus gallinarum]